MENFSVYFKTEIYTDEARDSAIDEAYIKVAKYLSKFAKEHKVVTSRISGRFYNLAEYLSEMATQFELRKGIDFIAVYIIRVDVTF
jgi:hypothetical protein